MTRLKIAIPNKGALSAAATDILKESGYRQRTDTKELRLVDAENDVEFFYLRPRDIALYVGEGTLDVGITGRDLLLDSGAKAEEVMPLEFGRSTFRFAGPEGEYDDLAQLAGKRIATSYTGIVQTFLDTHGIEAHVVRLDGAVETSIQLGSPTSSPTSSRPAPPCAAPASRCSERRSSSPRPCSSPGPATAHRRSRSSSAGSRASWSPAAT